MRLIKRYPIHFLGMVATLLFAGFAVMGVDFIDTLDLKGYDMLMRLRTDPDSPSDIVMVEIDDDSIEKLGRWPWSRSLLASGIRAIQSGQPRLIGLNIIFSDPEIIAGLDILRELEKQFRETLLDYSSEKSRAFLDALSSAQTDLDHDKHLAESIAASNRVVLSMYFKESAQATGGLPVEQNPFLQANAIRNIQNPDSLDYPHATEMILPIPVLLNVSKGIGHINITFDEDGKARRERLLIEYGGLFFPSFTVRLASQYLNIPIEAIHADIGQTLRLGQLEIPMTLYSEMLVSFKGDRGSFKSYPFYDVLNGKIPMSLFQNKLVLIHVTATGVMNPMSTPVDAMMPASEFTAHSLWSVLNRQSIREPMWGAAATLGMILMVGLIVSLVFPRTRSIRSGIMFWSILILIMGCQMWFFISKGLWLRTAYPILQLIVCYTGVLAIKYFVTETGKEKVEGESAETNRMLGLSFQSQGMLDMAFDKFRRVPVDSEMKDVLYNLALDYERKRQFNKAASVFEYIETYDRNFKDVSERKKKLIQVSETMVFGDSLMGSGASDDGFMMTGSGVRPTLGRYEIVRQLGKGAMGVVYLGQDPRINRTTAIKTFRLTEGLNPEQAKRMKEQFFREAESAGTLSHPHIVTIYDAGEEQELAYIAMEYLEGCSFEKFVSTNTLLPVRKVISYAADIAAALDYAHQKGVIHRDIKPANIMLLKNDVVKITDFGIARITAASQTQTGVVKGTPSYMSPEQFSGKKVDGR
ncbi:MAG: CHASE2 domain-containing protein, partial [Desulfatirhabdiaceae bacterium]